MTRLLVVSEHWWTEGGGGELATHLITGLLREFAKVTVLTGTQNPARLPGVRYLYDPLLGAKTKPALWANLVKGEFSGRLAKLIERSDVVYVPRFAYPVIPLAKRLGRRVVVHLHGYQPVSYIAVVLHGSDKGGALRSLKETAELELREHGSVGRAVLSSLVSPLNRLVRLWLSEADAVVCVSRRQAEIVGRVAPELASKLTVVYNPLPEMPAVEKRLGEPYFMYVGGDSYVKGFHVFLKASWKVVKRGCPARFLLAGNFRERSRLLFEALNRWSQGAYIMLGRLEHGDVLKLHSASWALLFPSICEEPLPYAVTESMLAETLPIASRVGGVPEVVQGTYAERMLFTPRSASELAERIEEVLSMSREQLVDIGAGLREAVARRFDVKVIKERLIKVFK